MTVFEPTNRIAQLFDHVLGPARTHRFGHSDDDAVEDVLDAIADAATGVHDRLAHEHDVFTVEFLGATGSGKTELIERLIERAPPDERIGVVVGDVAGDDDARRLAALDVPVVDVTTGKDCHLDPHRLDTALDDLGVSLRSLDRLYVENVGNMVCPADVPLGAHARVVTVSVTEGDDVVRKHPLVFQAADVAVVNKIDVADAVGADPGRMADDVERIDPAVPVVQTSARTGTGVDSLAGHLGGRHHNHVDPH
jgi:hydrogenase nickel incorporation protein HypB